MRVLLVTCAILMGNPATAHAGSRGEALRALGRASQINYSAQKRLGPKATRAQRQRLALAVYGPANKRMARENQRKSRDLAKAQGRTLGNFSKMLVAMSQSKNGKKGGPKAGKPGKGGAGAGAAKGEPRQVGRTVKPPSAVTGSDGAKGVEYGTDQDLKIIDGIIQD